MLPTVIRVAFIKVAKMGKVLNVHQWMSGVHVDNVVYIVSRAVFTPRKRESLLLAVYDSVDKHENVKGDKPDKQSVISHTFEI